MKALVNRKSGPHPPLRQQAGEVRRKSPQTIPELREAARAIERWLAWEKESLALFHAYAQRFGGRPGENVYLLVLARALQAQGLSLQQFKVEMRTQ